MILLASGIMASVDTAYTFSSPLERSGEVVYNFEIAEHHNYYVGNSGVLVHNGNCIVEALKNALKNKGWTDAKIQTLLDDFATNANPTDVYRKILNGDIDHEAWELLRSTYQNPNSVANALHKSVDALQALTKIRKNPHLSSFGITDDFLKNLRGWGNSGVTKSYAEIVDRIDNFVTIAKNNYIEADKWSLLFDKFIQANDNNKQAIYWILEDISNNAPSFNGVKFTFEKGVANARGTISRIDAVTNTTPPKWIEYKWYGGDGKISTQTIIEEFIERDLFAATSIKSIEWRIKGQKMTKLELINHLKAGRSSLDALPESQKKLFFPKTKPKVEISDTNITDFVNNNFDVFFK